MSEKHRAAEARGHRSSNGHRSSRHTMGKPPRGYESADSQRRREWLTKNLGMNFESLPEPEPEDLQGIIENHVGFIPMPMSVAAPLVIDGTYAQGEFAVPVCTLEGTLTLSMTRGLLAIAMAGGCKTIHVRQELSRSPYFVMPSVSDTRAFLDWVTSHFNAIREVAESTTRHGKLLRIDPLPLQNWVILDFVFDTGEAAGQNMVTIASDEACRFIEKHTGRRFYIESGYNSDKKPSRRNLMTGRGHGVIVEFTLPEHVLSFLGVTQQGIIEFQEMAMSAAQSVGMLGNNLHLANALSAIYLATGQDAACVAENAVAFSQATATEAGLYCRMTLPSLTVGTVGGGTRLPIQRRNLQMLGCDGQRYSSRKLAEIIAAAAIALEISLLSAVVSGTFAEAHNKYGRPKAAEPTVVNGKH